MGRKAVFKKSPCSLSIGRIAFVHMAGEQGSNIRDESRSGDTEDDDEDRREKTVTLYEDTVYRLHVQLDCNGQWARGAQETACDLSQNVNVLIDFNDRGYNDAESQVTLRPLTDSNSKGGAYNLELQIPIIDGRKTKSGFHRMRLTLVPTDKYRRECSVADYNEAREYTVNIVSKSRYPGPGKYLSVY
jgi:hypothetical protein